MVALVEEFELVEGATHVVPVGRTWLPDDLIQWTRRAWLTLTTRRVPWRHVVTGRAWLTGRAERLTQHNDDHE